ncbi:hypothetical protein ACIBEJ_28870 [Nonomuraea sp. NPDC050790]|uniref:hypothetical protein n=1 Tax=Nonomuraea sp. NPDC050790 TaxID=3364371 RepID=UPI00378D8ED1
MRPLLSPPPGVVLIVTSRETLAAGDDCAQVRLVGLGPEEAEEPAGRAADLAAALKNPRWEARVRTERQALDLALARQPNSPSNPEIPK